jgi:hypothetical protein
MRFVGELSKVIKRVSHASRKLPVTGTEARLRHVPGRRAAGAHPGETHCPDTDSLLQ